MCQFHSFPHPYFLSQPHTEFKDRAAQAIVQLNEQGLNAKLYWENDDLGGTVSLVPTSAVTGEGVPDLLKMVSFV